MGVTAKVKRIEASLISIVGLDDSPTDKQRFDPVKKGRQLTGKELGAIVAVFFASRLCFYWAGVRFDYSPLENNIWWSYLDIDLLKHDLLRSLFYLHIQPPGFNLFLGFILKAFPGQEATAFWACYLVTGCLMCLSMFALMKAMGVSLKVNVILTLAFILNPASILYENFLFYTYPVTAFLCIAALFLHKYLSNARAIDGLIFFSALAVVALFRSIFHVFWLLFFFSVLLFSRRHQWKQLTACCCIPFIVVAGCYLKNLYLFGSFSTSTWLGMSMYIKTIDRISETDRQSFVSEGKISTITLKQPFDFLDNYREYLPEISSTGIPALDREKKTGGGVNLNNLAYVFVSPLYLRESLKVLWYRPWTYSFGVLKACTFYFMPSTEYGGLRNSSNRKIIRPMETIYNLIFLGRIPVYYTPTVGQIKSRSMHHISHMLMLVGYMWFLVFCLAVWYGFRLIVESYHKRDYDSALYITILFVWANIVYVSLVTNLLEYGENMRFRFQIDPYIMIILGLFLSRMNVGRFFKGAAYPS